MSTTEQVITRPRIVAIRFDSALRYLVQSDTDPDTKYLVELDAYHNNGRCVCEDFTMRLEPILKKGISPEMAVRSGMITLKKNWRVMNSLRCKHCLDAFIQFAHDVLDEITKRTS